MPTSNSAIQLQINKHITEEKTEILKLIDKHHRVLLEANPASGKTHLFKELANDITNGKIKGRLIFVAPFLIITEQFKNDLLAKGINVDLELKGTTKRKELEKSDKIITSTFQSLHHIINELTEGDILVVDEAHALFYNYYQGQAPRQFYSTTVQNLYHTKSKVVLMSGTPNLSLIPILNLQHLIISKQNYLKAQINIEYSNLNRLEVVKEFAEKVVIANGKNKLNIIYLKSVNGCIKIGNMLNEIGYKTEVITSFHKDTDTYNSIIETQTIPNDIQFLVTTNVISTGTNINNKNIGSALMLDEYSPQEIKQFSKRFRNKLDITVEVVNKGYVTGQSNHDALIIQKQRNYLIETLTELEVLKNSTDANYDYENSYDTTDLATPNSFFNQTLERYLKQESFYIDDAQNSYDSPNDIAIELNKYNDINTNVIYDYDDIKKLNFKLGIDTSNSKIEANFKAKIDNLITDFEKNKEAYLSAIIYDKNMDYIIKCKTKRLVAKEFSKQVPYSNNILNNIKSPLFNKNILIPFLEFRKYFNSTNDFIILLKSKKNKNYCITGLLVNKVMTDNFDIGMSPTIKEPTLSYLSYFLIPKNNTSHHFPSNQLKIILRMIELTFYFCFDQEKILIEKLRKVLEEDKGLKKLILQSNDLSEFPLNTITVKNNSFSIKDYVVKGIVQGIFYTDQKLSKTTIKGKTIRSIKLKDKLPVGYSNKELNVSSKIYGKNPRITANSIAESKSKKPIVLNETRNYNYINSYELIIEEQF